MINRKQNIPQGWRIDLLENLADRGSGHTPDKNESGYWNGGIKWVSLADSWRLDNLFISETDKEISILGLQNSSAVLHPPNTVILSRDAGVGKSAILKSEMAVSQHFIAWRCQPKNKLFNLFFYYWLQLRKEEFERVAVGSTIKTIGLPYFKKLKIVYPPLAEQKKIAEIINCWDNAIAITEKLITAKRRLKQGLMQKLLTGKVRFPEFQYKWENTQLGNIANFLKGKGLPKSDISIDGEYKCIHYGELFTKYREKINSIISRTNNTINVFTSEENDVLMPTSDVTPNGLATASYLSESGIILGGDILIIRVPKELLNGNFLSFLISQYRSQVMSFVTGVTVYHLYASDMKKFKFKLPKIKEQEKIITPLLAINREIELLEALAKKYKQQKQGLMQQLLTGKIRVQTP